MSTEPEVTDTAEEVDDAVDRDTDAPRTTRRRVLTAAAWLVAFGLWSVVCFTWLFPLLTELGLDPTLGS